MVHFSIRSACAVLAITVAVGGCGKSPSNEATPSGGDLFGDVSDAGDLTQQIQQLIDQTTDLGAGPQNVWGAMQANPETASTTLIGLTRIKVVDATSPLSR